jgi:probable rRNA maturation factor
MTGEVDISITSPHWAKTADAEQIVLRAVEAGKARTGYADDAAELSVLLCDDAEIRRLNAQWRGKDAATNVLSFPTPEGPGSEQHLGDIAIAYETVAREAINEDKPFAAHLAHMAVHGYLHLVGFDHETSGEAEEMEQIERDILATLGIEDPYAATAPVTPQSSAVVDPIRKVR